MSDRGPCFIEPRCDIWQGVLFGTPLPEVLASLGVTEDEARQWRRKGWITVPDDRGHECQPWEENEITIVRDVVRAGFPGDVVERFLGELPRPCHFDAERIAYSFAFGWVTGRLPDDPAVVIARHLDEWMAEMAENGELDTLLELRARLDAHLAMHPATHGEEPA